MPLNLKAELQKNDIYSVVTDLYRDRKMSIVLPYGTTFKAQPSSNEVLVYKAGDLIRYVGQQVTEVGELRIIRHTFNALMPVHGMPSVQFWTDEDMSEFLQLQTKAGGESNES